MRQLCGLAIAAIGLGASLPSAHAQVTATGGTVTSYTDGGITYDVHTFTGSATFNVTAGGSVDYLIVGGGGGGGGGTGGGGGAGGFVTGTTTVTGSTAYTITVGTGGLGGTTSSPYRGADGLPSVFAGVTAVGGGGGGSNYPVSPGYTDPSIGGSGGGGSGDSGHAGASGTTLQGNAGGSANAWNNPYTPGGGGGAGAAGTSGSTQPNGAAGGAGQSSSITGIAKFYAGGGGSGTFFGSTGGTGGSSIGGHGGQGAFGNASGVTNGTANTGSGGGGQGGNSSTIAGKGGSGVVIIRFVSTSPNPTSTNATLAADENVSTALAAGDFGYADPNSSALAAVQITSLPTLGTLKNSGATVVSGDLPLTVSAANIGNLTYLSPLGGFGSPYTTMGIKVQNANTLWSANATMTVNVTHVNHPPTSTGGSVILRKNTVKTFAASDFSFSDIDAGDTLQAIKVTSLPAGTLTLNGTPITSAPSADIPVASIGTLTYTPVANYTGPDSFNFQVRDAALFSADATMAITVTPDIIVQNPSFETIGQSLGGPWATAAAVWNANLAYAQTNDNARFATRTDSGIWYANLTDPGDVFYQNLGASVNSGDTLSVTFYVGRENGQPGGVMAATFLVDGTPYTENFDTTGLTPGTWQSCTLTKTIANSGALTLRFSNVSGRPWLDNISNISVTSSSGGYANWAPAGGQAPGEDYNNDGVQNGIAYFMNATGQATLPGLINNTVTWTNGGNIPSSDYGTQFAVETSPDLENWTPVDANDPNLSNTAGTVSYTLTPGLDKQFARLAVTPN